MGLNGDKLLVFVVILLLSLMVLLMWGKQERFDEKVAQIEDCVFNGKGCYEKER